MYKLDYKDNEYESSDFDPLNIVVHDSIKDKKKDVSSKDSSRRKPSFKNIDFGTLEDGSNLQMIPSTNMVKDYKTIRLEVPYSPQPRRIEETPEEEKDDVDCVNITYTESQYICDGRKDTFNKHSTLNKVDLLPKFEETAPIQQAVPFEIIKNLSKNFFKRNGLNKIKSVDNLNKRPGSTSRGASKHNMNNVKQLK